MRTSLRTTSPCVTRVALLTLALVMPSCRAAHEAQIRQHLLLTRLELADVNHTPEQIDELVRAESEASTATQAQVNRAVEAPLRLLGTKVDGPRHTWCVAQAELQGCFVGTAEGAHTQIRALGGRPIASSVVRGFWGVLDGPAASEAENLPDSDVPALAEETEQRFAPRWSFTAGARSGAIATSEAPIFTFGGQAGVRYWANMFVIISALVEVENMVQTRGNTPTLAPQLRFEVTLWRPENERYFNLPDISFLMAAEPIFAFGLKPAVGARAVIGVHLVHLGRYPTPFFFELGFQSLEVDRHTASGLRVGLGIGI
jgi:hypothetical protein